MCGGVGVGVGVQGSWDRPAAVREGQHWTTTDPDKAGRASVCCCSLSAQGPIVSESNSTSVGKLPNSGHPVGYLPPLVPRWPVGQGSSVGRGPSCPTRLATTQAACPRGWRSMGRRDDGGPMGDASGHAVINDQGGRVVVRAGKGGYNNNNNDSQHCLHSLLAWALHTYELSLAFL